jgi:hypothetical protein
LLVEATVNNTEKNSEDFCPNYVQEFGLRTNTHTSDLKSGQKAT